ncbi:hypothetical protein KP78_13020 [Jeotgalibacillus soli]|uniref:Uncharacterized protein n=1 Tax=Jeotgalibacillus soli TaxID=889306 RepID=A0A0C2S724_9BACL|nr:hypothetical protein KP78_13020 [Jeotgalibacillus soli]
MRCAFSKIDRIFFFKKKEFYVVGEKWLLTDYLRKNSLNE